MATHCAEYGYLEENAREPPDDTSNDLGTKLEARSRKTDHININGPTTNRVHSITHPEAIDNQGSSNSYLFLEQANAFQPRPQWQNQYQIHAMGTPEQVCALQAHDQNTPYQNYPSNNEIAEIKALLQQNLAAQAETDSYINQLLAHIKMLENHIAQSASTQQRRAPETLPPTGESPYETANVIRTKAEFISDGFRSAGTSDKKLNRSDLGSIEQETTRPSCDELDRADELESKKQMPARPSQKQLDRADVNSTESGTTRSSGTPDVPKSASRKEDAAPIEIKVSFPQRLRKKTAMEMQFDKFLDVMKKLVVNVSFNELLSQVPAYAMFMKEILARKRSFN
ncbi:hypothetical protein RND81_04G032100 [Saponaria officinalis]|uniref:Uncharacterized protein n=2 Tax=Saponaria officinalis TaxID=3572 RepID=A0AAW1LIU6_SAPOF